MTTVAIVDYGMGNVFSVARAVEVCGGQPLLTADAATLVTAERVILPGVGAFAQGMAELHQRQLVEPLRQRAAAGRPLLGICLGMQMLFDDSEEFGQTPGLGLISGRVLAIPATDTTGQPHKIPHIGWNELQPGPANPAWQDTILADVAPGVATYFVHSFTAHPTRDEDRLADCVYGGRQISAVARSGAVTGCQFHPEKSGPTGLALLRRFIGANQP